jgi:hypothetical protein
MIENGNKPAYPSEGYVHQQKESGMTQTGDGDHVQFHGLTKRELFAMAAMQGILANPSRSSVGGNAAKDAVLMADELLKALEL